MKAMLKVIGQIVLILLAAGVIVGAFYLGVQGGLFPTREGFDEGGRAGERRFRPQAENGQTGSFEPGMRPEFGEGREHDGELRGADFGRGLFGVIGSLVKLTVIALVVLAGQTLLARFRWPWNRPANQA